MGQEHLTILGGHFRQHWRRITFGGLVAVIVLIVAIQLVYPWGALPPYTQIDGIDLAGKSSDEAAKTIENQYKQLKLQFYFGNSPKPYRQPTMQEIGVTVHAQHQVESAVYAWWLRLIPTSLWWAHAVTKPVSPGYTHDAAKAKAYVAKELGSSCDVQAVNATLEYKNKKLIVVPAIDGGTCKLQDVEQRIATIEPRLTHRSVRFAMEQHPARIHDQEAVQAAAQFTSQIKNGVTITVNDQEVTVPQADFLSWLDFAAPDTGIVATVNAERSKEFFAKQLLPKVAIVPGVSKVTTLDFTEISRIDGSSGRTLDSDKTLAVLNAWLANPARSVVAVTKPVAPLVNYTRTYTPTDTGMTALITQYAESHPGTYGVSFAELDGAHRHAAYQSDKVYRTASTYKLFVAYGALKRVESGGWHWWDQIQGGRDLTKCLDDMIVKSDNACGEAMLSKIGYSTLTNELKAIGLGKSSFMHSFPETTAGDLTTFVGALQSGQLLNPSSTSTLLSAMKRNIYRQGIPAGANGAVADKVGFLDAFLHDSAIVYSPRGTYALSIMTENSSWASIADLTRQIEKLRAQG